MGTAVVDGDISGFRCIAIDPPWDNCVAPGNFKNSAKAGVGTRNRYSTLDTAGIVRVVLTAPVWIPAEQCHLWLWVTSNELEHGLFIMRALGFRYITNIAWAKDRISTGNYVRTQHELCLFGTRGRAMLPKPHGCGSVVVSDRTSHSTKPAKAYELIERVSPGPRLEMFSRGFRPGWEVWGDQIERGHLFDTSEPITKENAS
jgi:N6-adenosine-specific RNA methylase IME4